MSQIVFSTTPDQCGQYHWCLSRSHQIYEYIHIQCWKWIHLQYFHGFLFWLDSQFCIKLRTNAPSSLYAKFFFITAKFFFITCTMQNKSQSKLGRLRCQNGKGGGQKEKHTWTSSSLRIGRLRTLYLVLISLERGELIIFLLMCEGAWKCLFLWTLLEDDTSLLSFIVLCLQHKFTSLATIIVYSQSHQIKYGRILMANIVVNTGQA